MSRRRDLFARISLDYADHPKIAALTDAAFRAHIEMILYSRRYMTDGQIAKQIAKRWPEQALSELLSNDPDTPSLTLDESGNYHLHGFNEMQETREEIEHKRRIRAEAGRKGGRARAKQAAKQTSSKLLSKTQAETETETETYKAEKIADAFSRDDVLEVFNYFNTSLKRLDAKPVTKTQTSADAIRRLIDLDGRTVEQIKTAIDFAHGHDFWQSNILSPKSLREKYDTLRLQAQQRKNTPQQRATDYANDRWALAQKNKRTYQNRKEEP